MIPASIQSDGSRTPLSSASGIKWRKASPKSAPTERLTSTKINESPVFLDRSNSPEKSGRQDTTPTLIKAYSSGVIMLYIIENLRYFVKDNASVAEWLSSAFVSPLSPKRRKTVVGSLLADAATAAYWDPFC